MKIYSHFGYSDFIIPLGYKGTMIKDYFVNKKYYDDDFTLNTANHNISHHKNRGLDKFRITFVDTGSESLTGERVRRVKNYIEEDEFMLTYGDGLANINILDLLKFHKKNKVAATVTGVYPLLKYGGFDTDKKNLAAKFEKKAKIRHLINGGFIVFKKSVFSLIKPNSMIEDVFDVLIKDRQLAVFKHGGFFHAMDTYQDVSDLNKMWSEDPAWKIWD